MILSTIFLLGKKNGAERDWLWGSLASSFHKLFNVLCYKGWEGLGGKGRCRAFWLWDPLKEVFLTLTQTFHFPIGHDS